jgi:hypothetical protein
MDLIVGCYNISTLVLISMKMEDVGEAMKLMAIPQATATPQANAAPVNSHAPAGALVQPNAVEPHPELQAPEIFKAQKPGKAKVEEGSSVEGKENPFFFRCYKPGHGKLECIAKLLCDICGSTDQLKGRCPVLKQPHFLAHLYGYDVSGLGFYHIPHAPINFGKPDNRTTLVTVHRGEFSIPQLVVELSRLIP